MRKLYGALTLLLLSMLFQQCQRELSNIGGPDFPGEIAAPDPITCALQGNVFDETGAPAAGVTVQAGNKTAITNARGYFRINDAGLDKKSAVVTAIKAGYFKAYRTFAATSGANNIEIKLVKRVLAGTIDAAAGGEASLSNGSKVALPANSIVSASTNAAYGGSVRVYAAYIDPSAADISQTVPGSFMATDKDGRRVILTSYGMLAVELESTSGEKLQIKSGSTATLTTAIPSAAQASAPNTIALWSVDETTGIWKEEGTATKSGNVYVGQVSHFSFWNCDVSQNAVLLSLSLKLPGGESFVHAKVRIKRNTNNWGSTTYGTTDSVGQVSGYVPYNETLVLDVLDECGNAIYTQNIGPFTQNTNLGSITVTAPATAMVTVKGKLLNCGNAAVTNGFALITFGNLTRFASVNASGDFQTTFIRCAGSPATVDIVGVDNGTQQQGSTPTAVTVVTPVTDAGNVSACGTSTVQYINYTLDGTNHSITSSVAGDSLVAYTIDSAGANQKTTYVNGFEVGSGTKNISFVFRHGTNTAGVYPVVTLAVQSFQSNVLLVSPFNVTVTAFPQTAGQFYEGSFTGGFKDASNATHTLSGTFKVRRSF
ncbi:MAG TPA: carboxypeptidase-like regulatory domain-containing protein [Flavisolibacter sp.]|nr:carboxypeptidase-like regulatory domain-containing protein [Flavisolibacter sp.]